MIEILQQGLLITLIGMGLVFVMIFALWGIMALLVKLTSKPKAKKVAEEFSSELSAQAESDEIAINLSMDLNAQLAAAIATAYAINKQSAKSSSVYLNPAAPTNQWLSVGRIQQLMQNRTKGRN